MAEAQAGDKLRTELVLAGKAGTGSFGEGAGPERAAAQGGQQHQLRFCHEGVPPASAQPSCEISSFCRAKVLTDSPEAMHVPACGEAGFIRCLTSS